MNNFFYGVVISALSLYCTQSHGVTITATEFNQLYSCQNPFLPNETSTIILDEDIVIEAVANGCQPIMAGPGFNPTTDVVMFSSTENHSVIVQQSGLWIVGLNLTFNGNAQLQLQTGAILALQNNPIVRMSGNSLFMPVQS